MMDAADLLRVFIGYDSREPIAFHVLAHSIMRHARRPVIIVPLVQFQLRNAGLYTRPMGPTESTEFSLTRFLVPHLCGYQGRSVFMDCDMLCRVDINSVVEAAVSADAPIACCQHDYEPTSKMKFLNQQQTRYPRKNWSSFMVFDNTQCRGLSPDYVNVASGIELHRLLWAGDDVAALPLDWNWLVGEYPHNETAKILHWTNGGPWFSELAACDHAEEWRDELARMQGQ